MRAAISGRGEPVIAGERAGCATSPSPRAHYHDGDPVLTLRYRVVLLPRRISGCHPGLTRRRLEAPRRSRRDGKGIGR